LHLDLQRPFNGPSALNGRRRDKTIWYRKTEEAEELSGRNELESMNSKVVAQHDRAAALSGFLLDMTGEATSHTREAMNITMFRRVSAALHNNACPEPVHLGEA
jgi:hypothetical protein